MRDTNISIYIMKRHPAEVLSRFDSLRQGDVVMSVVTHAELRAGLEMQTVNRSSDEQVLGLLIRRIPVLPFDDAAAVSYGILRAALRERNRNALDRLIGAHALSTGATLVTNNEADFKDYPGLVIENWVNSAQAPRIVAAGKATGTFHDHPCYTKYPEYHCNQLLSLTASIR